ncbi:aminopeptidase [Flavobacterium agricola]|uniref:Aminopeptidase n=1 Tax=Flavobacterium agricola TaxID=2870839 RepID=A0ABY6M1X5_9FLAO|nr:aminopeptidase [Flavobacterium agricola]UYW02252.1 aminopeptidase [Flavobacterium agricola]
MTKTNFFLLPFLLLYAVITHAQTTHHIEALFVEETKSINIKQQTQFFTSQLSQIDTLIFNDWNNAYASKISPLGKRFSDEFKGSFLLANKADLGKTTIHKFEINGQNVLPLMQQDIDLIKIPNYFNTTQPLAITIEYTVHLPNAKFSGYGIDKNGNVVLKNWLIVPSRIEGNKMVAYHNENLDDAALQNANFTATFTTLSQNRYFLAANGTVETTENVCKIEANGVKNLEIQLYKSDEFITYVTPDRLVFSNINEAKITNHQQSESVNKIVQFVDGALLIQNSNPVLVSYHDYLESPLYGLNQLPSFIAPFDNQLLFELKFLKTYISKITYQNFNDNPRTETWIRDGYQTYLIMEYINTFYPGIKMMGNISNIKPLQYYNLFRHNFNDQFYLVYLLMARKNLDQPIGDSKENAIKFNEQIAGRYKSGLNFNYLANYLGENTFENMLENYSLLTQKQQTNENDFFNLINNKASKPTDWFYNLVHSNHLIDYKIKKSETDSTGTYLHLTNKTANPYPTTLYTVKNDTITGRMWIPGFVNDTVIHFKDSDQKYVLNYFGEVPEMYRNNNWHNPNGTFGISKPIKLTFLKDTEDPNANQIFFLPEFGYNLYDGLSPALSFNNKSVLPKKFIFDVAPTYSFKTESLIGNASFTYNQMFRNQKLQNIRYNIFGNTYHYAPNLRYYKFSPSVTFSFRDPDLRINSFQNIMLRYVVLNREKSALFDPKDASYSIFNLRYSSVEHEFIRLFSKRVDLQLANIFGKISAETHYRYLFKDKRHVSVRGYFGTFLYNKTESAFFDFGVDRPTDYLYDYGLYGRSETTGFFSQQFVMAEGGFKSRFTNQYANQWLTTSNVSFTIWNWIEAYGDIGFMKSKGSNPYFIYDSGIKLNLVQDYFELYFPIYSSNGWEIAEQDYSKRIRFLITLSPRTLSSLFTRKWF